MAADTIITASLVEFYTLEQVREMWQQALAALASRSTEVVHINSVSQGDGNSSSGFNLSSALEIRAFIESCQAAARQLDPEAEGGADPSGLGHSVDFRQHPVGS